jgi:formylmethanofuran dehydrogenase subunit B
MVGGNLDTASAMSHGALGIAFPRVGESTATLGEIRNRADLLVFWGTDPVETHPRLFTRYSATANGMYVPGGRADRTVVVVDVRRTASAAAADVFVQVKPERDFEVAWVLRALVKGKRADPAIEGVTGVPLATLEDLASRMQRCRYGVLFFGAGLTARRGWQFNSGALLALAADLNEHTHFVANPVRGRGNGAGADNVVSWQTGFPFAVNLSRGYPRFNPGEFTAAELLARRDADAMLVFAADPGADFPAAAIERLRRIPVIVLGSMRAEVAAHAQVVIATATYGISAPGTVYRMDNVAVPLRPALQSACPSDDDALARIKERLRELLGGNRVPAAARAA